MFDEYRITVKHMHFCLKGKHSDIKAREVEDKCGVRLCIGNGLVVSLFALNWCLSSQVVHPSLVYHQPHHYHMALSVSQISATVMHS